MTELEQKWIGFLEAEAHAAVIALSLAAKESLDAIRDAAIDAVEKVLFEADEWVNVPATEISDLAYEVGGYIASDYWKERV